MRNKSAKLEGEMSQRKIMRQQIKRVCLPVLGICLAVWLGTWLTLGGVQRIFQQKSQRETEELVGLIIERHPEIDGAEIVQILRGNNVSSVSDENDDSETNFSAEQLTALGAETLRKYGIRGDRFASRSAEDLARTTVAVAFGGLGIFALAMVGYFGWRDWRLKRKVAELVKYIQDLSNRIYDLKLEENSEDELSILTNELYKITVLLKESAESNRKLAKNLENQLADISHQLKTPLTSLQIMIDEIYEDPEMPEKVRQDFLRLMSRQVESMSNLATTLLNLARLDNGTFKMHDKDVRVSELFDNVRQKLEILAELGGVELKFAGDVAAKIQLDLRWQTEALTNIVKNAIEHSPAGKKVTIRAEDCPLFLKITVQDEGAGMSAHDMRHIFERFYQVPGVKQDPEHVSVGIGLAFAKAIVEADNGQITVDSRLGEGSEFTVRYFR